MWLGDHAGRLGSWGVGGRARHVAVVGQPHAPGTKGMGCLGVAGGDHAYLHGAGKLAAPRLLP